MPTKPTGKSTKRTFSDNKNNATFHDLALSSTEERDLKAAKVPKTTWANAYNDMLAAGYKFTLKIDGRNNSTMGMIQSADYNPDEPPIIWVMRGSSAESVLLKVAWYWVSSDGQLPDPFAAKENELDEDDIFA